MICLPTKLGSLVVDVALVAVIVNHLTFFHTHYYSGFACALAFIVVVVAFACITFHYLVFCV